LRDALLDYDFDGRLEKTLSGKLASEDISPAPHLSIVTAETRFEKGRPESPSLVLVLTPHYAVNEAMDTLTVGIEAWYGSRERNWFGAWKDKSGWVEHEYAFSYRIDHPDGTARPWVAFGQDQLAQMLDNGIAQAADMLAYDFSQQGRADWDVEDRRASVHFKDRDYPGVRVREDGEVLWVRTGRGNARVLQGWQPVSVPEGATASATAASAAQEGGAGAKPLACPYRLNALDDVRPQGSKGVYLPDGVFTMGDQVGLVRARLAAAGVRRDSEGRAVDIRIRHLYIGRNNLTLVPVAVYEVAVDGGAPERLRVQPASVYDAGQKFEMSRVVEEVIGTANGAVIAMLNARCDANAPLAGPASAPTPGAGGK